jgi:predicted DCC family thiol-disulfide oxidoreductase YuxK
MPTRFQYISARFLFAVHFIVLAIAIHPLPIKMISPVLLILGVLVAFGVSSYLTGGLLFLLWLTKFQTLVFVSNPGAYLILFGLFMVTVEKPNALRPFVHKMFWTLFIVTVTFDFIAALNTALDLFPFGIRYEYSYLPPKIWVNSRVAAGGLFLVGLLISPLRIYAWLTLFGFHAAWMAKFGYSEFSATLLFTLPFLFNPRWSTQPADEKLKPIVFYDGICVLCNRFTSFLFEEDFARHFYYAPLQGKTAKIKLPRPDHTQVHSIVFLDENKCYYRLDAIIKIFSEVGGVWHLMRLLWLIPHALRDRIYMWVANHRYDWFGTLNFCPLPSPEERQYFRD